MSEKILNRSKENHNSQDSVPTKYWHRLNNGKLQCDLCPRYCQLQEGQRGLCFVRGRANDEIRLYTYGRSSGFCIDPIEKKPLNHFYPGTSVLSFGTAGCNLACKFCQNWDISKSREMDTLASSASPEKIAEAADRYGCRSVAFTYNDPVIFYEYALDVADACRVRKLQTVAVTAGYICPEPREQFFNKMDAVNVDLKGFTENFYKRICGGSLGGVLDTLKYIKHHTSCWLEITTLLIPGENDSNAEIMALCDWVGKYLGDDIPIHFSAFHPDWKMMNASATPLSTLLRAHKMAIESGLKYVYTGNVHHPKTQSTFCPHCNKCVIERDWYQINSWHLVNEGQCEYCFQPIAGRFEGPCGNWGRRRLPIDMSAND